MNAQPIQDLRTPRTRRSEFRSNAKLVMRPMQRVNVPEPDSEVSVIQVTLGFIALCVLGSIGLFWDSAAIHGFVMALRNGL